MRLALGSILTWSHMRLTIVAKSADSRVLYQFAAFGSESVVESTVVESNEGKAR